MLGEREGGAVRSKPVGLRRLPALYLARSSSLEGLKTSFARRFFLDYCVVVSKVGLKFLLPQRYV